MTKTSNRKAFYVISTKKKSKRNVFKIGMHTGDIYGLLSRYVTYFPNPIIYYFQYLDNACYVESKLKRKFYNERIDNLFGNKSEWVNVKYNRLYKYIKQYCPSDEDIIIDKHVNIGPEIISRRKIGAKSRITESLAYLQNLVNIDVNKNEFKKSIRSIILYYKNGSIYINTINEFANNFPFIKNSRRLFKVLSLIEWFEDELEINRFELTKLKIYEPNYLIKKMIKKMDQFQFLSSCTCEIKRKKEITARINKLTTQDRIMKFFMDIVNQFDDFYYYECKIIGKYHVRVYSDFAANSDIIMDHFEIINSLNIYPGKFCD